MAEERQSTGGSSEGTEQRSRPETVAGHHKREAAGSRQGVRVRVADVQNQDAIDGQLLATRGQRTTGEAAEESRQVGA